MKPVSNKVTSLVLQRKNLSVVKPTFQEISTSADQQENYQQNLCLKTKAMFPLAHDDWEENFQDLSGWCVIPSSLTVRQPCTATGELSTPVLASPESEKFHFNIELATVVPEFVNTCVNPWELASPQDVPLPMTGGDSAAGFLEHRAELITPLIDYCEEKSNIFTDDDYLENQCSVPLALVEGKLALQCIPSGSFQSDELQTPDIVNMIMDFPTAESSNGCGTGIAVPTVSPVTTLLDDFLQPLAEIDDRFDLVAYVFDENPLNKRISAVDNIKPHPVQVKESCTSTPLLRKSKTDNPKSRPSISKSHIETKQLSLLIKGEPSSDEDEDEIYEEKKLTRSRKRPITVLPSIVPAKRKLSTVSCDSADVSESSDKYRELRDRNNEASKKSRLSRKNRDSEMLEECVRIEKVNKDLRIKSENMERLVNQLRQELLEAVKKK